MWEHPLFQGDNGRSSNPKALQCQERCYISMRMLLCMRIEQSLQQKDGITMLHSANLLAPSQKLTRRPAQTTGHSRGHRAGCDSDLQEPQIQERAVEQRHDLHTALLTKGLVPRHPLGWRGALTVANGQTEVCRGPRKAVHQVP